MSSSVASSRVSRALFLSGGLGHDLGNYTVEGDASSSTIGRVAARFPEPPPWLVSETTTKDDAEDLEVDEDPLLILVDDTLIGKQPREGAQARVSFPLSL